MIAAEKWHEYEDSYRRYGLDMKPRENRIRRAEQQKAAAVSAKDRLRLIMLTVFIGVLGVAVIISAAYAAQLKYDINTLISQNTVIEGEIANLNVELKKATNITTIEKRAMEELGMTYPYGSQIVYLEGEDEISSEFAMLLKEQAYN